MKNYIKEMRIKHYIKNFIIYLPLFFSGGLLSIKLESFINITMAFVAFCLISSAVYYINDINDVEKDKKHPTKKNRPIASGAIPIKNAWIVAIGLILVSFSIAFILYNQTGNIMNIVIIGLYLLINILYSVFHFKDIPLLDVTILMLGFFFRLYMGSSASGIENSAWIYLVVIMGSFYLGFGKRKAEITKLGVGMDTRKSLKSYNLTFLDKTMYSCMTLAITFFALWCKEKQDLTGNILYLVLVPLMVLICFKYSMTIETNEADGDPVNTILSDKILLGLIFIMGICFFVCVYMG